MLMDITKFPPLNVDNSDNLDDDIPPLVEISESDDDIPPLVEIGETEQFLEKKMGTTFSKVKEMCEKLMKNDVQFNELFNKVIDKYENDKNIYTKEAEIVSKMLFDAIKKEETKEINKIATEASQWVKSTGIIKEVKSTGIIKEKEKEKEIIHLPTLFRNTKEYISYLTSDIIKKENMYLSEIINKSGIIGIFPSYKYTNELSDLLILQTSFKKIVASPFAKKNCIFEEAFDDGTIYFFKDYFKKASNYIKDNYVNFEDNSVNNDKIRYKLYTDKSLGFFSGKLFNYNISKKYKSYDSYNICDNTEELYKKIFYCKKEIRFMVSPMVYINTEKKRYGFALQIYTIEVKYPDKEICSVFNREINVEREVTKISI